MKYFNTVIKPIRNGNSRKLLWRIWRHIALNSSASKVVKPVISDVHEEKLYASDWLGYWPRIKRPRTFNEKLLHRKWYTDNHRFTELADKSRVRSYVSEKVGDEILNNCYHVTDNPDTIPFDSLPNEFVIKSTHGWNQVILVENKDEADFDAIRSKCREFLSHQHGKETNEYWYTRIEPQILVEKYIQDGSYDVPRDFKFSVFDGNVEFIEVHFDRYTDHTCRFYEPDWTALDITKGNPLGPDTDEPPLLDEMIDIAETLGEEFDFVRVDLYQPNGEQIIFGEMTFTPGAGYTPFDPPKYDSIFGSYW